MGKVNGMDTDGGGVWRNFEGPQSVFAIFEEDGLLSGAAKGGSKSGVRTMKIDQCSGLGTEYGADHPNASPLSRLFTPLTWINKEEKCFKHMHSG